MSDPWTSKIVIQPPQSLLNSLVAQFLQSGLCHGHLLGNPVAHQISFPHLGDEHDAVQRPAPRQLHVQAVRIAFRGDYVSVDICRPRPALHFVVCARESRRARQTLSADLVLLPRPLSLAMYADTRGYQQDRAGRHSDEVEVLGRLRRQYYPCRRPEVDHRIGRDPVALCGAATPILQVGATLKLKPFLPPILADSMSALRPHSQASQKKTLLHPL
jgi:hypothetical protein